MLIRKDCCNNDTCVALRELGYNAPQRLIPDYFGVFEEPQYDEKIYLYDAQKWLREEKHIDVLVYLDDLKGYFPFIRIWEGSWKTFVNLEEKEEGVAYSSNYEEALSEGIKEAVKILKEE